MGQVVNLRGGWQFGAQAANVPHKTATGRMETMHELGIANSVLDTVRAEAALRPGAVPTKVAVRVGELSGIDPDALAFSFEALTADTEYQRVKLEIETRPREHRCNGCGATFRVVDYCVLCPKCGSTRSQCISGEELELLYLEMEEPWNACLSSEKS